MAVTWFYSCENYDTVDIFDGSDSYPAAFDNTTAWTETGAAVWSASATQALGGTNSLKRTAQNYGERIYHTQLATYVDIEDEGSFGVGFFMPSGEWAGELIYPIHEQGANNHVQLSARGTAGSGSVRLRFRSVAGGAQNIVDIASTLAADTWYYVVFRFDAVAEDWEYEVYSSAGTLIDSASGVADSTAFMSWPTTAAGSFAIGDGGGDVNDRYYDNLQIGNLYADTLEDNITVGGYSDIGGGPTTFFQTNLGGLAPSGTIAKLTGKTFAGALTPTGAITKQTQKITVGSLTPSGSVIKQTLKALAGGLTPSGVVASSLVFVKAISGVLTPIGSITKLIMKNVAGSLAPVGTIVKQTQKAISGSLAPTGVLGRTLVFTQTVLGALTPTSILGTQFTLGGGTPLSRLYRRGAALLDRLTHRQKKPD